MPRPMSAPWRRDSNQTASGKPGAVHSVLSGQCLERRIPDKAMLTEETAAWEAQRNKKHAKADWQFTTANARVKLKRLYPSI